MTVTVDRAVHPCFNPHKKSSCARIHLPIADKCNIQCNFCNRKYDCANESRPGVTSQLLEPQQAVEYLAAALKKESRIAVAGIAGPGDPFANAERTLETLRLVRERFPALVLCVASNGLNVAPHTAELARLGVTHVTITVNAVDAAVGQHIYAWVRKHPRVYRHFDGARVLWENQQEAISKLKAAGITVKVNTVVIPGVNDDHLLDIAMQVSQLGADVLNCMALHPTADTPFETLREPSQQEMAHYRASAAHFIPQMYHCTRCRSDAVGLLGQDRSAEFAPLMQATPPCDQASDAAAGHPVHPSQRRTRVAVASWEGMLVNQHLGEASHLWVYDRTDSGYVLLESRVTPPSGGGDQRWLDLAQRFADCHSLLIAGIGPRPREILTQNGLAVLELEGLVSDALGALYRSSDIRPLLRRHPSGCGTAEGCSGPGTGCG